ncbi:basic helix-loop-helix (bHLH) DNA-binding superfamily protein [Rhynchospora pubera]|uniref:Basic helix-loop-helix (BHLH) DNA-binding superfamily protein n=1 Tax=Rhynchospora pubera TaxID=906938 RepID=A0AAV8FPR8_9POAL|nr:basic helix-loop-helix (bHLH) DNA-binding superfamily protein [Rhynchospora pubera]
MATDDSSPAETSGEVIADKSVEGSSPRKKGNGKVPKKIHKAEREKLKRDQLNDLFSDLHNMLETDKQNNGKATILGDASRILRDLFSQVDTLRKENAALVKESHYVTQENNELRDEKGVLQTEIIELQNELRMRSMRMGGYDPHHWPNNPAMTIPMPTPVPVTVPSVPIIPLPHQAPPAPIMDRVYTAPSPHQAPPAPIMDRVYTAPSPPRELQLFPETTARQEREPSPPGSSPVLPPAHISRPHVRYSGLGDLWTGQLLAGRVRPEQEEQYSSGVEDGLDRV